MTELSAAIKQLRKKTGLSAKVFAERLGLSDSAIWLWESGKAMPSDPNLEIIQREFGVNLAPLKADAVINVGEGQRALPKLAPSALKGSTPKRRAPARTPAVIAPALEAGLSELAAEMTALCARLEARLKAVKESL